ncbi:MAG TPA: hypothetical protein VG324_28980, partial [Blastocatellia bacterium]|nr:hypothetical protein [Blastocatellia bacterium]
QAHHEREPHIHGAKEAYDYVEHRNSLFQTVVTATISNRELIDGLAVEVQAPNFSEQEMEYLCMTRQESYTEMEAVEKRLVELLSYQRNRMAYRKRTEMAVEIVRQIENEGEFPLSYSKPPGLSFPVCWRFRRARRACIWSVGFQPK